MKRSKTKQIYLQYGCGTSIGKDWINIDVSPILWIKKYWVLRPVYWIYSFLDKFRKKNSFPDAVEYGNIVRGFRKYRGKCRAVYCSHVLEHLSLVDCRVALKNTYDLLEPGGHFRLIVPDLEVLARTYLEGIESHNSSASHLFFERSYLGIKDKKKVYKDIFFSNLHLWMWDRHSLRKELENAGFENISEGTYGSTQDVIFEQIESPDRFCEAVCFDCYKKK